MCRAGGRGGGGVPPSLGGVAGGPRGAGGGGSLCLGPSLCLSWAGTKAGFIGVAQSMEGVVCILLRFTSARRHPYAVHGVPLRAGAGLQACRGHCGSGRVTIRGRATYGPSGAPPRVPRPSRGGGGGSPGPAGGVQGRRPLGRPPAFRGLGGGGGGEGGGRAGAPRRPPSVPWFSSSAAAGGGLKVPAQAPPTAGSVAPRAPPCNVFGRGCLASVGAGRGPWG